MLDYAPDLGELPTLPTIADFITWIESTYLPHLVAGIEMMKPLIEEDDAIAEDFYDVVQHVDKARQAVDLYKEDVQNWVYWQEAAPDNTLVSTLRPIQAAPFFKIINDAADIKIYMTAFAGDAKVFCRGLGLDPKDVAWASLNSPFLVENRPIIFADVGSLSFKNITANLPAVARTVLKLANKHATQKGLIHCVSYKVGEAINAALAPLGNRVIFPRTADEREAAFKRHTESSIPTIMISPSMTEGFDFAEDLARWQVIVKVPWPYMKDMQVARKKDLDPDWYATKTIMSIIQACGRICRSDTDFGVTYILDSDFNILMTRNKGMFPRWFLDAIQSV